jgi:hypothetical protein
MRIAHRVEDSCSAAPLKTFLAGSCAGRRSRMSSRNFHGGRSGSWPEVLTVVGHEPSRVLVSETVASSTGG